MGRYRLPTHVNAFMLGVLSEGEERFGSAARDRYAALLRQAMQDIADEPRRLGAKSFPDIDRTALFYPIRYSRDRVEAVGRVGQPRHIWYTKSPRTGLIDMLGLIPDVIPIDLALTRFIPGR